MFNVIAPRIEGAGFLDLCAGSGAVGIEALSRGAAYVAFVDRSRKMCALIESNLDLLNVPEDETEVFQAEAADFLRRSLTRPAKASVWNLIFFDPPYTTDYQEVFAPLGVTGKELLAAEGLLIVEHHHKKHLADQVGSLTRTRILKQGDSSLSFYERRDKIKTTDSRDQGTRLPNRRSK